MSATKSFANTSLKVNVRVREAALVCPPLVTTVLVIVNIGGPISNVSGIWSAKADMIPVKAVFKSASIPSLLRID